MDPNLILVLFVAFIILVVVKTLAKKVRSKAPAYQLQESFLSPAERSFYGVLCAAVADEYVVLAKVRVADIIRPRQGLNRSKWQSAFNKVSAKHFDFILCDPSTLAVEFVVELNDRSHRTTKRAERDDFLRAACESAGLKLREFRAKARYSIDDIRREILGAPDRTMNEKSA